MVGIYKITNPKGRVYIGQAVCIEKRKKSYEKLKCKGQPRLYASLVKYGFSAHIFEVVEKCGTEELNTRERYWQDFYDVLYKDGLNCKLTKTSDKSGKHSQETVDKQSDSLKEFYSTKKGLEVLRRRGQNVNYININYASFQDRRLSNIDFTKRTANTNYASFQHRRVCNTDYKAIAEKKKKSILQFNKNGTFTREWPSIKEAGEILVISSSGITNCAKGRTSSAGGFIWKYRDQ